MEFFRWLFRGLNRWLMLPWFRVLGGPTPTRLGGSLLVLHCRGRRTGRVRDVPLNYAPAGAGSLWIIAGFGSATGWLHNLRADPNVEVTLGRKRIAAVAREVTDPAERLRAIRAVCCHAGIVGYVYGFSPFRVSDARLRRVTRDVVAMRVELAARAARTRAGSSAGSSSI